MMLSYTGKVAFYHREKGYGFIAYKDESGKENQIFTHISRCDRALTEGLRVRFTIGKNHDRPIAENVEVIKDAEITSDS